jgi:hypothetical protein
MMKKSQFIATAAKRRHQFTLSRPVKRLVLANRRQAISFSETHRKVSKPTVPINVSTSQDMR